ncbi:hypothetical protein [Anaerococcus sp. Marseille-P3915]|uniref:hypothetical protein n=1 Tax=Anaerococcus sp. Marseille-P3915 TaxID=2057799 RepID=UPI000D0AC375|nr:hypothetical protein [Anaerococcus sp. Marseille-P3915]
MKDIDKVLEDFRESRKAIKKDLSSRDNILYIFDSLSEDRKDKLLSYAEDVFYSQRYQEKTYEVPILNMKLSD